MSGLTIERYVAKFPLLRVLSRDLGVSHLRCDGCGDIFIPDLVRDCAWVEFPDGRSGFFASADCLHQAYCAYLNLEAVDVFLAALARVRSERLAFRDAWRRAVDRSIYADLFKEFANRQFHGMRELADRAMWNGLAMDLEGKIFKDEARE